MFLKEKPSKSNTNDYFGSINSVIKEDDGEK